MSDEQHQSLREYSYDVIALPNAVPPVPHNQATLPREHPAPDISQDSIFMPPVTVAPAAHLAYPHRVGYAPHYGPIPPVSTFTGENLRIFGVRTSFTVGWRYTRSSSNTTCPAV